MQHARWLILVLLAGGTPACGGKKATCEKAKKLYLESGRARAEEAIATVEPADRERLRAAAEKEIAEADAKFMAACETLDEIDLGCFENRERQDSDPVCKQLGEQLGKAIYGN